MSASLKVELCDERGNRVLIEASNSNGLYVTGLIDPTQKLALECLEKVRAAAAKKDGQ